MEAVCFMGRYQYKWIKSKATQLYVIGLKISKVIPAIIK